MKIYVSLLLSVLLSLSVHGASMVTIWQTLPSELLPYMDARHRQELAGLSAMGMKAEGSNLLLGKTSLDTLTTDYLHATLNGSVSLQIKRLPTTGGDSLLCVVKTWRAPMADSELRFYNQSWQPVEASLKGQKATCFQLSEWIRHNVAVDEQAAQVLAEKTELTLASATLDADTQQLVVCRQTPFVASDDHAEVEQLLAPLTLVWTGEGFEEKQ